MKVMWIGVMVLGLGCNSSKGDLDASRCAHEMVMCTIAGTDEGGGYNTMNDVATEVQLNGPNALALDASGQILISDARNYQIRRIEGDQLMTVVGFNRNSHAITGPATETPLAFVSGMDIGPDGLLYLVESQGQQLSSVDVDGGEITVLGGSPTDPGWNSDELTPLEDAVFAQLSGVAVADDGTVYVADAGYNLIYALSTDGMVSKVAGMDEEGFPRVEDLEDPEEDVHRLDDPQGLGIFDGQLYVADAGRHRIVSVDLDTGALTNVIGVTDQPGYGDDVPFSEAKLNDPWHFTFGADGRMVVSDSGNGVIRAELSDGTIDTIAGRGTGGYDATPQDPEVSSLGRPVGLLYDAAGDLVFADFDHAVVRRISQPNW